MSQAVHEVEVVARAASDDLPVTFRGEALAMRYRDGIVPSATAARWATSEGLSTEQLMQLLVPLAASMAHAPVSGFRVGAVTAADGTLYLGANYEFERAPLGWSVHAEQAAVNRAWIGGASSLEAIATSAPPCGHCRQFISEVQAEWGQVRILTPDGDHTLGTLLPHAFAPDALGVTSRLLESRRSGFDLSCRDAEDELALAALEAARASWVPYSGTAGGAALRLSSGAIVTGRSCENAAFNPSLSPLQSALAVLGARRSADPTIQDAVFAEEEGAVGHWEQDRDLLGRVAPAVAVRRLVLVRSR